MSYDTWMKKRWYIVVICVLIGSASIGAVFPEGIGGGLTAGIGVAAGFLLSYLVYKIQNPE